MYYTPIILILSPTTQQIQGLNIVRIQNSNLKQQSKFFNPRYTVPENGAFDAIASEHLLTTSPCGLYEDLGNSSTEILRHKREEVEFMLKRCKNCALNRPDTTKAPLVPIVTAPWMLI
jgi:hypothetical protein